MEYENKDVRLCDDGKYRWVYEMNMITNPTVFLTVFKIFFWIVLAMWVVFGFFLYVIHGDWEGLLDMGKAMLLVLGILAVLTFLGVLLLSAAPPAAPDQGQPAVRQEPGLCPGRGFRLRL
jgi:hypothetical protein